MYTIRPRGSRPAPFSGGGPGGGEEALKLSYALPDPSTYPRWSDFESDLACMRACGYQAVELQIADPVHFDEEKVRSALDAAGLPLCAFQTGSTYSSRGNCLCSPSPEVRERAAALLRSFVELAGRWKCIMIFGSLQGRLSDEPDYEAGRKRIVEGLAELCAFAAERGVVIAIEPVNHLEAGWHNTIADVARLVRSIAQPSARLMIDTFHMNIEERDMVVPFMSITDILVHVHLSETNRDVLGFGHCDLQAMCDALGAIEFAGHCTIGVYNTILSSGECINLSMHALREAMG